MTVKELKEILDACNDDAVVFVSTADMTLEVEGAQLWAIDDGQTLVIKTEHPGALVEYDETDEDVH